MTDAYFWSITSAFVTPKLHFLVDSYLIPVHAFLFAFLLSAFARSHYASTRVAQELRPLLLSL